MNETDLWLGSEASLLRALKAMQYGMIHPVAPAAEMRDMPGEEDDEGYESYLIQKEGSVGMVNISGSLVAEDAWYNEWLGLVSYPEIARAMQELVADEEVSTILLNIDSGGGTVAGLEEASDAIKWAKDFKKVEAHTSGGMLSAAYWLGATADSVTVTKMADLGSVGVLIVHRSVYEALKEDGIEYTVIRAGKYKALGHPTEKLSEEAKEILQSKADALYGFFLDHVSTERPQLNMANAGAWAEGLTFFGQEAVGLGLADRLMGLSDRVESLDVVDKHRQDSNNNGNFTSEVNEMPKGKQVILRSEADKARLENGANLEDLETVSADTDEGAESAAAEDQAATTETADAGEESGEAASGEDTTEASAADSELVTYLKDQNKQLTAELATANAAKESAKAELAEATTSMGQLRGIVEKHIHRMQIPLNSAPIDMTGLPAATIVTQHGKVLEQFDAKFKVDQHSRPFEANPEDDKAPAFRRTGIVPKS